MSVFTFAGAAAPVLFCAAALLAFWGAIGKKSAAKCGARLALASLCALAGLLCGLMAGWGLPVLATAFLPLCLAALCQAGQGGGQP